MTHIYKAVFDEFKKQLEIYGEEIFLHKLSFAQINRLAMLAASVSDKYVAQLKEKLHLCTECGQQTDNIRSTSMCADCQIVELMRMLEDCEGKQP